VVWWHIRCISWRKVRESTCTNSYQETSGSHKLFLPANSSRIEAWADSLSVLARHWYIPWSSFCIWLICNSEICMHIFTTLWQTSRLAIYIALKMYLHIIKKVFYPSLLCTFSFSCKNFQEKTFLSSPKHIWKTKRKQCSLCTSSINVWFTWYPPLLSHFITFCNFWKGRICGENHVLDRFRFAALETFSNVY